MEQVDEVLGGDVPGRPRRERAAADPADRRVEHGRARLERGEAFAIAGVARVVQVHADRRAELAPAPTSVLDLPRDGDADRVGEDDLVRARGGQPLRERRATRPGSTAPSNGQPNATPIVTVARTPSRVRAPDDALALPRSDSLDASRSGCGG